MNILKLVFFVSYITIISSCTSPKQIIKQDSNFPKLNIAEEVIIHSNILNEDREIYIYYPTSKEDNTKEYPVLYLMDGDILAPVVASQIHYLSMLYEFIPPMIIVGVNNYKHNRTHDLTPTNSLIDIDDDGVINYDLKTSGGGGEFIQFLEEELIPYIESKYATKPYRILSGMSFGGLMSLYCLTHKDIFDAYIAISPSLWWDNNYLIKEINKYFETSKINNKKVFMSIADEKRKFRKSILKTDSIFSQNINGIGNYKFNQYPDETHGSGAVIAIYEGIKFIYADKWVETTSESSQQISFYYGRGSANLESGDSLFIEASISDFNKAIELNPSLAVAYAQRALAKARINRHAQALIDFNVAEELGFNFSVFYFNRGYTNLSLNNYNEALSDFKKSNDLEPNNTMTYLMLGNTYRELKNFEKSSECYNNYLKLNQGNTERMIEEVREAIREMGFTPEY